MIWTRKHIHKEVLRLPDSWSNWLEFGNVGFWGEGKLEYPEKNLLEQRREPTTNSTYIWRRHQDLNPGHTGGRRALSQLRHPSSSLVTECWRQFQAFTLSLYPISQKSRRLKPPSSQFFSRLPALNENPGLGNTAYPIPWSSKIW